MSNTKYKASVNQQYKFEITAEEALALDTVQNNNDLYHVIAAYQSKNIKVISANYSKKTFTLSIQNKIYEVCVKDKYDMLLEQMGMNASSSMKLNHLKAPMPGLVLKIMANEGETIAKGTPLLILEAMKMENVLKCPTDAKIKTIKIKAGDAVEKNQILFEFA